MTRASKSIQKGLREAIAHAKGGPVAKTRKIRTDGMAKSRAQSRLTSLQESIREARKDIGAYLAGDLSRVEISTARIPDDIDVKSIRENLALSQSQFARLFGIKLSVVQSWERTVDRKKPSRATRVFLTVLERRPQAVLEALAEER